MKKVIGVDIHGNIRYRHSKKNPIILRSGILNYPRLEPDGDVLPIGILKEGKIKIG